MLRATYTRYILKFKQPAGTSRGILTEKETWFVKVWYSEQPEIYGLGECALFRGLSADDTPNYEKKLAYICQKINGLIWMGDKDTMRQRIIEKLDAGFHCVKLKIGAIDFEEELDLLRYIRKQFSKEVVELRVDANGAFTPQEAPRKLEELSRYDIHSIEQPIRQGQWEEMAILCRNTPIPIALDEELIGIEVSDKSKLLDMIRPQYIVIKPSLSGSWEWIARSQERNIGWWITSALESNIGLNAIAQWTAYLQTFLPTGMPQGLGTGQLYTNNIPSPLEQTGSTIRYNPQVNWDLSQISF